MKKFWKYESGVVEIDEQCLYDFLYSKGFRYFRSTKEDYKFIVRVIDNNIDFYIEQNLRRFCCYLIEKEFKSLGNEELMQVKKALIESKKTLKKGKLTQLKIEDLQKYVESESKKFLQRFITKAGIEKGGSNE